MVPVPPATAYIRIFVHFESTKYKVNGYTLEGKKQVFSIDFPFNEAWIDGIIARKMKLRDSLNFSEGSAFLKTRLKDEGDLGGGQDSEEGWNTK